MRVTLDDHEVKIHIKGLEKMPKKITDKLWKALQVASIATERTIKSEMPVATGRARASWGHWTEQDLIKPNPEASERDAIWAEKQGELAISQGTNVPYVPGLNAGHSQQAPAGFINLAEEKAKRMLKDSAAAITRKVKP